MGFETQSKATAEEIKKAEEVMTHTQEDLSETRESLIEKLKSESGLDAETFDEIVASFKYEDHGEVTGKDYHTYTFRVRGHDVIAEVFGEDANELAVDGELVNHKERTAIMAKYGTAMLGLGKISNEKIRDEVVPYKIHASVEDLLK